MVSPWKQARAPSNHAGLGRCRQPGAAAGPCSLPCFHQEIHVYPRNSDRRFLGFRAEIVFLEADRGSLHGSYCFWPSADLGFTSGSHFLVATTGIFFFIFFLDNEFLDDAVEETATRRAHWFAKPPQYAPVRLRCTQRGDSVVFVLSALPSKVFIWGRKTLSTIQSSISSAFPPRCPKAQE